MHNPFILRVRTHSHAKTWRSMSDTSRGSRTQSDMLKLQQLFSKAVVGAEVAVTRLWWHSWEAFEHGLLTERELSLTRRRVALFLTHVRRLRQLRELPHPPIDIGLPGLYGNSSKVIQSS